MAGLIGEPLGEQEIRLTERSYGWPEDAKFLVPDGVVEHFRDGIGRRGGQLRDEWFSLLKSYRSARSGSPRVVRLRSVPPQNM